MAVRSWIDGIEVSAVALEGSVTKRLNRPSQAQLKLNMLDAIGQVGFLLEGRAGARLKIEIDGELWHHGRVLLVETEADEDSGYTVYNSTDPLELWKWRPVRDSDGDFSKPSLISDFVTGPQIIGVMLSNSENAGAGPPADTEGPSFLEHGSFAIGGVDLTGVPTDWPMTMAELASLLVSTGEVDIVLTPIDSGSNMARIDVYNGNYGTDRRGEVIFQYGTGLRNVRAFRWNEDMTNLVNKLWYYLGPRIDDQHWHASINQSNFAGTPLNPVDPIALAQTSSRNIYGVRMKIDIFDAGNDIVAKNLYLRLWRDEASASVYPRQLLHVTPIRGTEIGSFDIGDLITTEVPALIRGGISGFQRVYEYTVSWNQDSVLELSEILVSSDQEGGID